MVLKKSNIEPLISQFADKFSREYKLDADHYEQLADYVSGETDKFPSILVTPKMYAYDTMSTLEKIGKRGMDETFYRAADVLFRTTDNKRQKSNVLRIILDDFFEAVGLSRDRRDPEEKGEKLFAQFRSVKEHMGLSVLDFYFDELLGEYQSSLKNSYSVTKGAVHMMVMLHTLLRVEPGYLEPAKSRLHPLLVAVLTENDDEVRRELSAVNEKLATHPLPRKECTSLINLDRQLLKEKVARVCADAGFSTDKNQEKPLSHSEFKLYSTLLSTALLYRVNLYGGKTHFCNKQDVIDRLLLDAAKIQYEIIPLDLIYDLTQFDYGETKRTDELIDGLVPTTEPYGLIIHLTHELRSYHIDWEVLKTHALAEPAKSERAIQLVSDPLLKGFLYKTLHDHGFELSDSLEEIVLSSLKADSRLHKLYQFLTERITLEELFQAGEQVKGNQGGLHSHDIKGSLLLLTFLGMDHPLYRRFFIYLSRAKANEENMRLIYSLFTSDAFDPVQLLALYADEPEANADQFLFQLLNMKGSSYYFSPPEQTYKAVIADNLGKSLAHYAQLGADARLSIMETVVEQKKLGHTEHFEQAIVLGLQDSSKKVSGLALAAFTGAQDKELFVRVYHAEKKAKVKELALDALRTLPDHREVLQELLAAETNNKFKTMLQNMLDLEGQKSANAQAAWGAMVDKRKLTRLKWLAFDRLPPIKDHDGNELGREIIEYALTQSIDFTTGPNPNVLALKETADPRSLADLTLDVLNVWIDNNAVAKEKWVMFLAAGLGDRRVTDVLASRIKEWADIGRGALASDAVRALSFMDELAALRTIDHVKRTVKNRQVKNAAFEALAMAANNLQITPEELEDRLVTTLGFDAAGKRVFSYGPRSFTVKVSNELALVIMNDETGKAVKSLPAVGQKDDAALAEAAKADFAQLKKDLKNLISIQGLRLEESLSKNRVWNTEAWRSLFVDNVLMQKFAIGLIWGVYDDTGLKETFRYMDDGTFNTVDEDEYELQDDAMIGLVHPIELTTNERDAWKTQLDDYEITQPFAQLGRELFFPTDEETNSNKVARFTEGEYSPTAFPKSLEKYGWYKGMAQDGGWYHEFYKEYGDMIVELTFSGTSITYYDGLDDISLEELGFYRNKRDRYHYYQRDQRLAIADISPRVFSETIYDIKRATGK